jgi:putative DNA primase/helicase
MPSISEPRKNGKKTSIGSKPRGNQKTRATKRHDSVLRLSIDRKPHDIRLDDLRDADKLAEFESELRASKSVAFKNIAALLGILPGLRIQLFQALAALPDGARLTDGEDERTDVFDAVLRMRVDLEQMSQADAWRFAVLEAAVVKYPASLDMACGRICERVKELGQRAPRRDTLVKDARKILSQLQAAFHRSQESPRVGTIFSDAPVGDDVRLPAGWEVSPSGIRRAVTEGTVVAQAPIIISGRSRHLQEGVEYVDLAWLAEGQWHRRTVPRAVIADRRKLVELAAFGLPVTSNNAGDVVEYLAAFEATNVAALIAALVSDRMGYHNVAGEELFLWGETVIRADRTDGEENNGGADDPPLRFVAPDLGNHQLVQALRSQGKFLRWREVIEQLASFPRVRLALYTSLAAVLLKILEIGIFIVDFSGESSIGKTTTLRVAISAWGNAWEAGPTRPSLVLSWDTTPTFQERAAETLQNIPVALDETKRSARLPDLMAKAIYTLSSGRGRGRGSVDGVRSSSTWWPTFLSSGEQSLSSFTPDGGTRARVISIWGSPFGAANAHTALQVRQLEEALRQNYGHAGPRFVRWLLDHRDQWNQFRKRFAEIRGSLMGHAAGNPLAMRITESMAAICLAEELAIRSLKLSGGRMVPLCVELLQLAVETDRAADALRHVLSWASANQARFAKGAGPSEVPLRFEIVGRWDVPDADWVGILPHELERVLKEGSFDLSSVVAAWRDRSWLVLQQETNGKTRNQLQVRIGGRNARVFAIRCSAIEEVNPSDAVAANEPIETDLSDEELGGDEVDDEEHPDDESED